MRKTISKLEEGNFLNLVKGISTKKTLAKTHNGEKTECFPLRLVNGKNVYCHYSYLTSFWKLKRKKSEKVEWKK